MLLELLVRVEDGEWALGTDVDVDFLAVLHVSEVDVVLVA